MTVLLRDCIEVLESAYDPALAEPWDAVGLVVGDPGQPTTHVHLAVDPTPATAAEALRLGADLLVTHHPLLLHPVHSVAATTEVGKVVAQLLSGGAALFSAHTNADAALPGVSDALAGLLGVAATTCLQPASVSRDLLVTYVPRASAGPLLDALAAAGAGRLGAYERCAFLGSGTGTFRPLAGARPAVGAVGRVEEVDEVRLELVVPRARRSEVVRALRDRHPYEEPAFSLVENVAPGRQGLGRVGDLPEPVPLAGFAERVARALPATAAGVRVRGEPGAPVRRVAVCGGAGLDLAGAAAGAGADVFVTADARHHAALSSPVPLVDVAHWASEVPWLRQAGGVLRDALPALTVTVSEVVTDPWRLHL